MEFSDLQAIQKSIQNLSKKTKSMATGPSEFRNLPLHVESLPFSHPLYYLESAVFDRESGSGSKFKQYLNKVCRLEELAEEGSKLLSKLYASRGLANAVGMFSESSTVTLDLKLSVELELFGALHEEMKLLHCLFCFHNKSTNAICKLLQEADTVEGLKHSEIRALLALLDIVICLDQLKDVKPCFKNDFSRSKRMFEMLRSNLQNQGDIHLMYQDLDTFLGVLAPFSQLIMILTLKQNLETIQGYEEHLSAALQSCLFSLENHLYGSPGEKHRYLRCLGHLLILVDNDNINMFQNKKIKLSRVQKIFRLYPCIPLFGDISLTMQYILPHCVHYIQGMESAWILQNQSSANPDPGNTCLPYKIENHRKVFRNQFEEMTARLVASLTEAHCMENKEQSNEISAETAEQVSRTVVFCLKECAKWNSVLLEFFSWKYTHPAVQKDDESGALDSKPEDAYAQALQKNLSSAECEAITEIISMIKDVAEILYEHAPKLDSYFKAYMHQRCQDIVQAKIVPILHRADKYDKPYARDIHALRTLVGDWRGDIDPSHDYKEYSRRQGTVDAIINVRVAAPTHCQIIVTTDVLYRLLMMAKRGDRNSSSQKVPKVLKKLNHSTKGSVEKDDLIFINHFLEDSYFFSHLRRFRDAVMEASNLGGLWLREFYLDITRCSQFPLSMSLPWILIKSALSHYGASGNSQINLLSDVSQLLKIYDDAVGYTLDVLKQRFIYDEIVAEVSLVCNQLAFLLGRQLFKSFQQLALENLHSPQETSDQKCRRNSLAKFCRQITHTTEKLRGGTPAGHTAVSSFSSHQNSSQQRIFGVIGHYFDFHDIWTPLINKEIMDALENAIKKYEGSSITNVIDLCAQLNFIKETHTLLHGYFDEIDSFDHLFSQANDCISPIEVPSRIGLHSFRSIVFEVVPAFCFNVFSRHFLPPSGKFSRRKTSFREKRSTLYPKVCPPQSSSQRFVGPAHFATLYTELGAGGTYFVVEGLLKLLPEKISQMVCCFDEIRKYLPSAKQPRLEFHTEACYRHYDASLRPLSESSELLIATMQTFREVGNILALFFELCKATDGVDAAPLQHQDQKSSNTKAPGSLFKYTLHMVLNILNACGLSSEYSCCKEDFQAIQPSSIGFSYSFSHLFSALNFVSCQMNLQGPDVNFLAYADEFGHGFTFAGLVIINLLGQQQLFEMMDFSNFVLRMFLNDSSQMSQTVGQIDETIKDDTREFISKAAKQKKVHDSILEIISSTAL